MRTKLSLVTLCVSLFVPAAPGSAHHSFSAEFDANLPVVLKGTLTKVERVNPHGWIFVDVRGPDGKVVNWAIETGAPNALARRGVGRDSLPIGTEVVVRGYRAKDGSATANGDDIKLANGQSFSLAGSLRAEK